MVRGDTELGRSTWMPTRDNDSEIASLRRWLFDGEIQEVALARLMSDPRLLDTIRALAVNSLDAIAGDKALERVQAVLDYIDGELVERRGGRVGVGSRRAGSDLAAV